MLFSRRPAIARACVCLRTHETDCRRYYFQTYLSSPQHACKSSIRRDYYTVRNIAISCVRTRDRKTIWCEMMSYTKPESRYILSTRSFRIGVNGFDNPMRDPKTEEVKKQVGLVSITIIILTTNMLYGRMSKPTDAQRLSGQTRHIL